MTFDAQATMGYLPAAIIFLIILTVVLTIIYLVFSRHHKIIINTLEKPILFKVLFVVLIGFIIWSGFDMLLDKGIQLARYYDAIATYIYLSWGVVAIIVIIFYSRARKG